MIPTTQYELARALFINMEFQDRIGTYGNSTFETLPEDVQEDFIKRAGDLIETMNQHGVTLTAKGA